MKKPFISTKTGAGCSKLVVRIPDDILLDILVRLSLKSLLRCKCVCKHWCSLIRDPTFVQLYLGHVQKESNIAGFSEVIACRYATSICFYSIDKDGFATEVLPPVNDVSSLGAITSCNGLLCFIGKGSRLQACNPVTRETLTLPKSSCHGTPYEVYHKIGFAFDTCSKKYKVVYWPGILGCSEIEVLTLGLGTKLWRKVQCDPFDSVPWESCLVYLNGTFHWQSISRPAVHENGKRTNYITTFNVESEKFGIITHPAMKSNKRYLLSELRGRLWLIESDIAKELKVLNLWVLADYEKQVWVHQLIRLPVMHRMKGCVNAIQSDRIFTTLNQDSYICCYDSQGELIKLTKVIGLPVYANLAQPHLESLNEDMEVMVSRNLFPLGSVVHGQRRRTMHSNIRKTQIKPIMRIRLELRLFQVRNPVISGGGGGWGDAEVCSEAGRGGGGNAEV
ncbi:hypothetical protein IFM89_004812 [Coptis chinensis]|uniref:F-box domain-containing protein n=1 Tax=Coptis chinensis TaxID=261450 RepID=A0A835ITA6_9MAGN|nr:hypothetical protein IFM89_004812 [Coptis chinensis]